MIVYIRIEVSELDIHCGSIYEVILLSSAIDTIDVARFVWLMTPSTFLLLLLRLMA